MQDSGGQAVEVAYGTTVLKVGERPRDLYVTEVAQIDRAGLSLATRFVLDEVHWLPWTAEWFLVPEGKVSPVIGSLSPDLVKWVQSVHSSKAGGASKTRSRVQWVYLDRHLAKQDVIDALLEALDTFVAQWQRATFKFDPAYPLDQLHRDRLIQGCEAVIGMLKADVVERSFLSSLAKRMKVNAVASTVFIATIGGAAGGGAGKAVEEIMSRRQEAADNARAAETVADLIDRFVEQLPPKVCGGIPADEARRLNKILSKGRIVPGP